MSHYAVAVVHRKHQSIDELLAPFDENLEVEAYVEYTREQAIEYVRSRSKSYAGKTDDECYKEIAGWYSDKFRDEDGNLYSTYNPQSKWDWYTVGGRWEGFLRLKNGERVNEARISEIDFNPDPEQYRKSLRLWEVVVDGWPLREGENEEDFKWFYSKAYYTSHFNNAEEYALYQSTPAPYSILTPDGKWLEAGNMGWFGMSCADEDAAKKWHKNAPTMLQKYDGGLYVTIVDCHI